MPSPYAKLLLTVNGGAPTSGGITAATGDVIQLSGESTVGWKQQRFEISDYPLTFACPSGWSTDPNSGAYFYALSAVPPPFTLGAWGKTMLSLVVNNGTNGSGQVDVTLTDTSTALSVPSPTVGLVDLGFDETNQFAPRTQWTGAIKADLRLIETALTGSLTALSSATPGAVGTSGAAGTAITASRGDHVHALGFSTVQSVLGAASGNVSLNSHKLTGLLDPTAGSQEAATAHYVDGLLSALVTAGALPTVATLATVDATPTIIASIAIPTSSVVSVYYKVTARTAGGKIVVAERRIDAKRDGGGYSASSLLVNTDVNTTGTAPTPITGTADITAGALYGGGGTLDGLTLIGDSGAGPITLNLSGVGNAASEGTLLAAIMAEWPAWTVGVGGVGGNKLTIANPTHGGAITIGAGSANAALGLTAAADVGVAPAVPDYAPGASTAVLQLQVAGVAATNMNWTMVYTVQTST